ncbi:MAG: TorF family putative porin [Reyranella sp.]
MLLKKFATLGITLFTICASGAAFAQGTPDPATPPATEKESWKAPFGGNFTAGFAFLNDYSYRGISQTQLQVAAQVNVGYETPTISQAVPISAYVGAWGSNVYFPNTGAIAEVDLLTGLRLKTMEDKLTFDLGYIRYNYLGAASNLFYDFNEFGLVGGYDFGVAQFSAAVRYSPNFFANSGIAWYKWAQVTVPLPFIKVNENVAFKVFGNIGNQYVERFANYGIPTNNYWDWQLGAVVSVYGFDISAAYTDTNIDVQGCLNTLNCQGRIILGISKAF